MSRDNPMMYMACNIRPGDVVDLAGDPFADPHKNGQRADGHAYGYEFEYAVVEAKRQETVNCVVLYTSHVNCGFPPRHLIPVVKRGEQGQELDRLRKQEREERED